MSRHDAPARQINVSNEKEKEEEGGRGGLTTSLVSDEHLIPLACHVCLSTRSTLDATPLAASVAANTGAMQSRGREYRYGSKQSRGRTHDAQCSLMHHQLTAEAAAADGVFLRFHRVSWFPPLTTGTSLIIDPPYTDHCTTRASWSRVACREMTSTVPVKIEKQDEVRTIRVLWPN